MMQASSTGRTIFHPGGVVGLRSCHLVKGEMRLHSFMKVNLDPGIRLCLAFQNRDFNAPVGVCNGQFFMEVRRRTTVALL